MAWPALEFSEKVVDSSQHQGEFDFVQLKKDNPDIKVVIHRLANIYLVKDAKFDANYQAAKDAGFESVVYANINPSRQGETHWEVWMRQLGNRRPKFFMLASETSAGMSVSKTTEVVRDVWQIGVTMHTWHMAYYTAAWWWNSHIAHGWEDDHPFVIAHYPYFIQDTQTGEWRQVRNYGESDPLLPIGNNFTPRIPDGVDPAMVVGWQLSEQGMFAGVLPQKLDMEYWKLWYYNQIWKNGGTPPVGGCPDLSPKLRAEAVALSKSAKVLNDEADILTEQASRFEGYADEAES